MKHQALLGIAVFSLILVYSSITFCATQISSVTVESHGRIINPNSFEPNYHFESPSPNPLWYAILDVCSKIAAIISCVIIASKRLCDGSHKHTLDNPLTDYSRFLNAWDLVGKALEE
jgi:hypothetical protein